jgi:hypothetical protein
MISFKAPWQRSPQTLVVGGMRFAGQPEELSSSRRSGRAMQPAARNSMVTRLDVFP